VEHVEDDHGDGVRRCGAGRRAGAAGGQAAAQAREVRSAIGREMHALAIEDAVELDLDRPLALGRRGGRAVLEQHRLDESRKRFNDRVHPVQGPASL
jgi:hypothetical protein